MRRGWLSGTLLAAAAAGAMAGSGCSSNPAPAYDPPGKLMAPATCGQCHMRHFSEWSQSAHAKAADDPVFLAMNRRGQRETKGKLGNFCVQCHAPMAVREGKTTDGLNLASVDPIYKGVTCYFCHSIDGPSPDGGHDNAGVHLANDLVMRGELTDPVANASHASKHSTFQDKNELDSAVMCGYCHDIASPAGADIERTFAEWSKSPFDTPGDLKSASTCAAVGTCHMSETPGIAIATGGKPSRTYHAHNFPAVDVPLAAPDHASVKAVQDALDNNALVGALCVGDDLPAIRVVLDAAGVGHHWPSGASQDRRAWVEVVAYGASGSVIYSSGVVPAGTPVTSIKDPDLWLLRDCMFDSEKKETHNFWEAASVNGTSSLPGLLSLDPLSQAYYMSHLYRTFPSRSNPAYPALSEKPKKVTLRVLIQPVGLDVLNDLVDTGDLDPGPDGGLLANMPTFEVSLLGPDSPGGLEWPAPQSEVDQGLVATVPSTNPDLNEPDTCTVLSGFKPIAYAGPTAAICTAP